MSVTATLLLVFFAGCLWTYLILTDTWPFESQERRESREHLRVICGELVVAISAGFLSAWVLSLISQANEHLAWTVKYTWTVGIAVGVVTFCYQIFKEMRKMAAARKRRLAHVDTIRSGVQQWFDGLTSQQKRQLGGWSKAVMHQEFLTALQAVAHDWDFKHGHTRRFLDDLGDDTTPLVTRGD